ncbi:MAG: ABC transporter substrate-binding protein [Chloroflexota bacterium]
MDTLTSTRRVQLSRRQLVCGLLGSVAALGVAACARRVDVPAPAATTVAPAASTTLAPAAAAVAPTAASGTTGAGTPKRGGMLMAATQTDWTTFDGIYNSANGSTAFSVFDPLFFFKADEQGNWKVTGGLIEKWDFTDTTATWQLRRGVTFHDGSPWNADALKWNVERMLSDPKSLAASVLSGLDAKNPVTVVDPNTVKINLTQPAPSLVEQLSAGTDSAQYTFPISPAAFQKLGAEAFGRSPVGTGPFKFGEWRPSDRVILQRNENYWMSGADGKSLPYVDGLTYRLIIDDSVRAVELKSHTVDFTDLIAPKDIAGIKADSQLSLIEGRWVGNSRRLIFHAQGGPFSDNLKLRQAVLYSIDRETLSTTLGQGQGDPSRYMLLPGSLGYDATLPSYWYDLDKAKSLMIEAGYPSGIDVSFIIIAREVDKAQSEVLKQMWEKIGVRATIDAVERAALNQRILSGGADYQVTSGQYGNYAGDADVQLRRYMHSKGGFNKSHMANPQFDAILDKASGTYDTPLRTSLYHDAQMLDFNSLAYYGYLWTQWYNWALNKRVANFPQAMGGAWDFRNVWLTD